MKKKTVEIVVRFTIGVLYIDYKNNQDTTFDTL